MTEKPSQNNIEKPGPPIGVGSEKRIYNDPINKNRVIAKFREHIEETENQTKARYYLTKILHLLLPKNIPDMHWAGSDPYAYATDKVEIDESHKKIQKYWTMSHSDELGALYKKDEEAYLKLVGETIKTTKTISSDSGVINLQKKIDQLGVRGFSKAPVNYSKDKEGNVSYLDSFDAWKFENDGLPHPFFDFEKLENTIDLLPENNKKTATNFLQRLKELYEEERDKNMKKK